MYTFADAKEPMKSKTSGYKWRLFRATNFLSLMHPSFFVCSILGLSPYEITPTKVTITKIRFAHSTFTALVVVGCTLMLMYQIHISGALYYKSVPRVLQVTAYGILSASTCAANYVFSSCRARLLQNLSDLSATLPAESFSKLSKVIHVKDIVGFAFLSLLLPNVTETRNVYRIIAKVLWFYMRLMAFAMDMLYMNCVCLLRIHFEKINESLLNMKEVIVKSEPHLLRRVYHEQRNPLLLMELAALRKRHLMVTGAVQMVNSIFNVQIVTGSTLTFIEITFGCYFAILFHWGVREMYLDSNIWFTSFYLTISYYWIKISAIVWGCERTMGQAERTRTVIHEVILSTSNKEIREELQLFSLQTMQQECKFAAKGVDVDAHLLAGILGSTTTYLLILIQFLISDHKE